LPALGSFLLIVAAVCLVVAFVFGTVVPVGYVGVRKIAFGPKQGLLTKPLKPGFHWTVPGYSTVYRVPQTVRVLDFDRDVKANASFGSLDVPTTDGTTVDIDVSVLYRFSNSAGNRDGIAFGGPAELINNVGATETQWSKYLSQAADNELKRSLGSLSTVDFYDPKAREERVKHAEKVLRETLAPLGIQVESVLLRRYTYREEIDQAIFKKNLQELESAYNKVAGDFAEAQRDVNKVAADGDVAIQNLDKQGISEVERIRSEGDLYRRQKVAEGDLLVAEAKAAVDKQRSDVLSKAGSDVYVALQLTQLLGTLKGGVVSNLDPYDLDAWVKKLAGAESKGRIESAEASDGK
jgi:regulator of protease activity HflC (stomatin/prohibitin superfamily)